MSIYLKCKTSVLGKGCERKSNIKELTFIQTHWYTPPHGCYEGDYWNEGEGQFICPYCGNRNRLINEREPIKNLKFEFKSIEKVY